MSLAELRENIFLKVKSELSDKDFMEIEKAMGMLSVPGGWPEFSEKSPFMMVPEKGLMVATLIKNDDEKFRITLTVNLGEIRIGFLLSSELTEESIGHIRQSLENVYGDGVKLAVREDFIDFVITGQFAETNIMLKAMMEGEEAGKISKMSNAIAESVASSVKQYFRMVLIALGDFEEKQCIDDFNAPKSVFVIEPDLNDDRLSPLEYDEVVPTFRSISGKVKAYRKISGRKSIALVHWPLGFILSDADYDNLRNLAAEYNFHITLQDTLDVDSVILEHC